VRTHVTRREIIIGLLGTGAYGFNDGVLASSSGIKVVWIMSRADGVTEGAFNEFCGDSGDQGRGLNGIRGFVYSKPISETKRTDVERLGTQIDGIMEFWFDSAKAYDRAIRTSSLTGNLSRSGLIGSLRCLVTQETIFVPIRRPSAGGLKSFTLIVRKEPLTSDEFVHEWMTIHGPMARKVPQINGFTASKIVGNGSVWPGVHAEDYAIDGIAESWSDSAEARATALDSSEGKKWYADGARIMGKVRTIVTSELIFVRPPTYFGG
jgi:uncharacterized protein (TIGR02118 family)